MLSRAISGTRAVSARSGADNLGVNAVQNQIGQSREKYHGKAAARARYENAEKAVYTLSPRAVGDLLIRRSFGDAAAVRKAVFGQAQYRGAAVRARARDISKATVRARASRNIGGAVPIANGPNGGAVGHRRPRGIRRAYKRERTLSPCESGGGIYGADSKIRKAR